MASLAAARALVAPGKTLFVIGGAAVYQACWPVIERIELTEVHAEVEGDTRLQSLDLAEWREAAREAHAADVNHAHPFSYVTLLRR